MNTLIQQIEYIIELQYLLFLMPEKFLLTYLLLLLSHTFLRKKRIFNVYYIYI